jgi:hypothetical protein
MSATTILIAVYFFPSLLALFNNGAAASDKLATFILNTMLGWTVIGWLFVFFYAIADHKRSASIRKAKDDFYLRKAANHSPN